MTKETSSANALLQIGFFRITLGIYLLIYNVPFWPKLDLMYGSDSMLPPGYLPDYLVRAPAYFPWPEQWFPLLFAVMLIFIVVFTCGLLSTWMIVPLYLLQVYFYHANPLIIHEAQPLANLFLFLFFFLPPDSAPRINVGRGFVFTKENTAELKTLLTIIIAFFGVYYFVVGVKKLPDPLWRQGSALQYILDWNGVARENWLNALVSGQPWLARIMSYGTLCFEMSFLFFIFTRLRIYYIFAGLALHGGIFLTMDVGSLSLALIVWYALLFDQHVRAQLAALLPFRRQT